MKYKIGIFGSSTGEMTGGNVQATKLGNVLGQHADSVIVITGGCSGLPYVVAKEAAAHGSEVWGYTSALNEAGWHKDYPDDDIGIYSKLIYVPEDYPLVENNRARMKYRNVISTGNSDAGIVLAGRWGTLNEFTNLVDLQKTVGVLTGTGGIADELPELSKKIYKEDQGQILFDNDPEALVAKILESLNAKA